MMRIAMISLAAFGLIAGATTGAAANDAEFLETLDGQWSGTGSVKVRTNQPTVNVSCRFATDTSATSLSLDGTCTGLLVVSRAIKADLKANGTSYSGSYVGAASGTAGLSGKRNGEAINLGIRWAKEINGDRAARMTVEKVGENGLRLTTVDKDPETGKSMVTSRIDLKRS